MAKRTTTGKWEKGTSGNPGGRPGDVTKLRELARVHTELALNTLVEVASDKAAAPAARVAASNGILDRGYGKPPQSFQDDEGNGVIPHITVIYGKADDAG